MSEDELIEKLAMAMFPAAWADHDDPHDDGQISKKYARFKARVALAAIRKAVGDPLTLVAHIRKLEADNKDFLEQIAGKKPGSELSQELRESLENPIVFNVSGADPGHGYEGET
jgi:hypothetical protein